MQSSGRVSAVERATLSTCLTADDHAHEKQSRSVDDHEHYQPSVDDGLAESPQPGLSGIASRVLPKSQAQEGWGVGVIWDEIPFETPVIPAKAGIVRGQHISKGLRIGFPLSRE
jgi:hypothetical protein